MAMRILDVTEQIFSAGFDVRLVQVFDPVDGALAVLSADIKG